MSDILGSEQEQFVHKIHNVQEVEQCNLFNVTDLACGKIEHILSDDEAKQIIIQQGGNPEKEIFLRFSVIPGGCKGMQYDFSLDNQKNEDDLFIARAGRILVAIDSVSLPYVKGSTLDFYETIGASAFRVINPNTGGGCGCGKSFST